MELADFTAVNDRKNLNNDKSGKPDLKKEIKLTNNDPVLLSRNHKKKLDSIIEEVRRLFDPD